MVLPARSVTAISRGWAAVAVMACASTVGGTAAGQEATLVMDAGSGDILYSYRPDYQLHPASLTKMMTLYLAFEALKQRRLKADQPLPVSDYAASQPRSKLGLESGTTITTKDAILALITKSANDAAVVLAESMADVESDFARKMTRKARELGMTDTIFRNASGLHENEQITTARDMAKLAMALLRDHPHFYEQFSIRSFSWHGRRYGNHNPLLSTYEGADGIKTGYIRQSGYNLVGSAERDGRRLIAVVLGSKTPGIRDWTIRTLLDFGFAQLSDSPAIKKSSGMPHYRSPTGPGALKLAVRQVEPAAPLRGVDFGTSGLATSPRTGRHGQAPRGGWAVQVGAYPSPPPAKEAGRRSKESVPDILSGTKLSLPTVERQGTRFYRARLVGLSEQDGRLACQRLARLDIPCLAVSEDGAFRTSLVR